MSTRICMWSGPRNLSTAMMRSFEARADCAVIDEPFFAPFLAHSGKDHPGRAETLATHETDPDKVAEICAADPVNGEAIYFQKHMPHHMLDGFPLSWADGAKHFFLIRHPARVITSYTKGRTDFTLEDIGYPELLRFYQHLCSDTPVLDCDDILTDPKGMLTALCAGLNIPFDPAMLSWARGPRETDGAWAPYWYKSVENSSGFSPAPKTLPEVDPQFEEIYQAAMPYYQDMLAKRVIV